MELRNGYPNDFLESWGTAGERDRSVYIRMGRWEAARLGWGSFLYTLICVSRIAHAVLVQRWIRDMSSVDRESKILSLD
jgi:hypothetical protein